MNKLICVFISLLLVSLLILSACDEQSYTIDEVVTAVIERDYDWEKDSTGNGVCWTYGPFEIGNFKITLATLDKVHITTGTTDLTEELMYIYVYLVDESDTIQESVKCIQTIDLKATTQYR